MERRRPGPGADRRACRRCVTGGRGRRRDRARRHLLRQHALVPPADHQHPRAPHPVGLLARGPRAGHGTPDRLVLLAPRRALGRPARGGPRPRGRTRHAPHVPRPRLPRAHLAVDGPARCAPGALVQAPRSPAVHLDPAGGDGRPGRGGEPRLRPAARPLGRRAPRAGPGPDLGARSHRARPPRHAARCRHRCRRRRRRVGVLRAAEGRGLCDAARGVRRRLHAPRRSPGCSGARPACRQGAARARGRPRDGGAGAGSGGDPMGHRRRASRRPRRGAVAVARSHRGRRSATGHRDGPAHLRRLLGYRCGRRQRRLPAQRHPGRRRRGERARDAVPGSPASGGRRRAARRPVLHRRGGTPPDGRRHRRDGDRCRRRPRPGQS